jgi:UDP-N-acetyl-2-amino-2-deoxyglucuronate dehydrogenase
MTRIGILGGGNISQTHARAARDTAGVEIVAHWSRNTARAQELAAEFGGAAFSSLDDFFERGGIDVVLIGTPSGAHAEPTMAAAARGIHVLAEKPLEISTERIDPLIDACDKNGVTLGVFFQDRTAPHLAWLREQIESGALGRLSLITAQVKWYRPPAYYAASSWRGTWALDGGGALMNQGTHTVDLLLWLAGDVERVRGTTRTVLHDIEVEDTALACLEFANGAVGTLEVTTAAYPGFPRQLVVTGTEGSAVVEGDRIVSVQLRGGAVQVPAQEANANPSSTSPVVSDSGGHQRVLTDFLDAIRTGRRPVCDGREGRRSVALVQAIYAAACEKDQAAMTPVEPEPHG